LSIFCTLVGHSASAKIIQNAGHSFSACIRCRADLVDLQGTWTEAPAGQRIVWKERVAEAPPAASIEESFTPFEAVLELTEPLPLAPVRTLRKEKDRRRSGGQFPAKFAGVDRRRGIDRRNGFGKKPVIALE
jgi:hypothetical protein